MYQAPCSTRYLLRPLDMWYLPTYQAAASTAGAMVAMNINAWL